MPHLSPMMWSIAPLLFFFVLGMMILNFWWQTFIDFNDNVPQMSEELETKQNWPIYNL